MYERMLDKSCKPTFDEFTAYCGACEELFKRIDRSLIREAGATRLLRFPYGNHYGWGMKYVIKNKHICDIFAENGSFTVMLRLPNTQFEQLYADMSEYTKHCIDNKYPCGEGGWIHYRVLEEAHLQDILVLLQRKEEKP